MQHIILFYKYHPLSEDRSVTAVYQQALERLCTALDLRGRILLGCSRTEGINGSLAGKYSDILAFTKALQTSQVDDDDDDDDDNHSYYNNNDIDNVNFPPLRQQAVTIFRQESRKFFETISESELLFESPEDFKWSNSLVNKDELFPDLNIRLASELIGTGGVLTQISLEETAQGYLTPQEWHKHLQKMKDSDDKMILIDCRNTKEYAIGRFEGALDPQTTTFAQFPKWVDKHKYDLANRQVLMYCTGGIRCEKASAYVRKMVPDVQSVKHLKGGIHKYLEEYGGANESLWHGKNFVFDGRGGASGEETKLGKEGSFLDECLIAVAKADNRDVVGQCVSCEAPFDIFDAHCVCTVCREPTLVCHNCRQRLIEYHCRNHFHLRTCYFTNLKQYTKMELNTQLQELYAVLDDIAVGRKFRQKRKTIQKQIDRIVAQLETITEDKNQVFQARKLTDPMNCRNCGDMSCSGRCWGFFGLKRKELLNKKKDEDKSTILNCDTLRKILPQSKKSRRSDSNEEIVQLQASMPPDRYRDPTSGLRIPLCSTRILRCNMKAKWCGQTLLTVIQNEFIELSKPEILHDVLKNGLLKINGKSVKERELSDLQLKSSDMIGRVVHWHEAPVEVPECISVEKVELPATVQDSLGSSNNDLYIYVCNKPATVPVHPAGPFLSNSLTLMIEAQEGLQPQSLKPLHRIDRVTSGLTLCCTNKAFSSMFHKCIASGNVDKLYLARVGGNFPSSSNEVETLLERNIVTGCKWLEKCRGVRVDAPIHTIDPAAGIRIVDAAGKQSQSVFQNLMYDETNDTSLVACFPITGRNHQLRVHLQYLGYPIINDTQYGGRLVVETMGANDIHQSPTLLKMIEVSNHGTDERRAESLTDADVSAAKRACPCCSGGMDGILKSFTSRQLLLGGHAIHLHALRYRIRMQHPKQDALLEVEQNGKSDDLVSSAFTTLDLSVDPPAWARIEDLVDLGWLNFSE